MKAFGGQIATSSDHRANEDGAEVCDGCGGCGVRVPAVPSCHIEIANGWCVVERCDLCEIYDSDYDAALTISNVVRTVRCDSDGSHVIVLLVGRDPPRSTG